MQPKNPKNFPVVAVIISVIVTAVVVGGGVYFWQAAQLKTAQENLASVQQQITTLQSQIVQLTGVPPIEPETAAPQPETYTNQAYGFSLTFPVSWGKISMQNVTDTGSSKMRGIRLSSETDPTHRYIQINIARIEDKNSPEIIDAPQTFIKDSNLWSFYYTSGGDCAGMPGCEGQEFEDILTEASQIIQTFTLK